MADVDEEQYLAPDFDASSLTVPRLRNLLVTHNVTYPSNAKKPQLVQLFNDEVVPQARKLLAAKKRTKPSSRGIVDVPSSQASTVDEDEAESELPLPTTRKSTRRKTRAPEEDSDATLLPPDAGKSRRTTSKHARSSDAEPEPKPAPRRSKSSTTPVVTIKQADPVSWHREDVDSPFTTDNPFQSGSSPPVEVRVREGRRRTLDPASLKDKRKSLSNRRRTEGVKVEQHDANIRPPASSTFQMPVAALRRKLKKSSAYEDGELIPAGEEFTPEEAFELAQEEEKTGETRAVVRRSKQSGSGIAKLGALLTTIAMMGGFGFVWRQEKLEVGYCGIGREPSAELGGIEIPEWAKALQPQCEPCPQHAFCYSNLETQCDTDFILKPHPLSLGGLVPLPPTCEPDSEKARRVSNVAARAVEELRERNAKFECGEPISGESKPPASPAMPEEELKEALSTKRSKRMSQEEFEALWEGAIGEVLGRDEVISNVDGGRRSLRSTSLAHQSLACTIRRSLRLALAKYIWPIVTLLFLIASGSYTRYSITYNRATEEKAKQLASFALDRLATQAALHAADPDAYPDAFVSMNHLRDDVLRDEFSASRRAKLWEKVQGKVEGNSNIRPMVREGRHGDVSRVWEWIGGVNAIEGMPVRSGSAGGGSKKRVSGRFSLPASSPYSELSTVPPPVKDEGGGEMEERKWQESRPIY